MANVRIKTNSKLKRKEIKAYQKLLGEKLIKEAMYLALQTVANKSAMNYWNQTSGIEDAITAPVGEKLTMRTGTLIGSIMGVPRFSDTRLPSSVRSWEKDGIRTAKKYPKGKNDSIREVTVSGGSLKGVMGSKVVYAAIHEFGGNTGRAKIPSRPYLRPAVADSKSEIMDIFKNMVNGSWDERMKEKMN